MEPCEGRKKEVRLVLEYTKIASGLQKYLLIPHSKEKVKMQL